ncbi:MAG: hypothetical protein JEY99_03070 [Spirochaetales bacterium]|nr:hypothetical protein [Spirochaetales bacterium]
MSTPGKKIQLHYRNSEISGIIEELSLGSTHYSCRFNQNEEFFLHLDDEFTIPAFKIHHEVSQTIPDKIYLEKIKTVLKGVIPLAPEVFHGLKYFFNPAENLRMSFFQVYRANGNSYLYLMKIDLEHKPGQGIILTQATNDQTAEYRTRNIFIECDIIPINTILSQEKPPAFILEQNISQTWIGQRGKGYLVQGIWIDAELTKFFTKLFLPQGQRNYPYYPFSCRHKTICHTPVNLSVEGRKKHLLMLIKSAHFLKPRMERIEAAMKQDNFSESNPVFQAIKKEVPPAWTEPWKNLKVTPFLNEFDMKEFTIDFE